MPRLTIHHRTEYTYAKPVAFGEHRVMLRPRDGHDLRVLEEALIITPTPQSLRFIRDLFGNTVGIVKFSGVSERLTFESRVTVDHRPSKGMVLSPEDYAYLHPFAYDEEEMPDLLPSIRRQFDDPDRKLELWARQFVGSRALPAQQLLADITHAIKREFIYEPRFVPGVQSPAETLRRGRGTCRDFAVFMMEAARSLGYAARFVSGYLHVRNASGDRHRGGGATHAWAQVYLPSAGWVEFDPTNGIVGNTDLIRVAIARAPRQAIPIWGTFTGRASDQVAMNVDINVDSQAQA